MSNFFGGARPGARVKHGAASFELPILYFRDIFFSAFVSADLPAVQRHMPSRRLHPVSLGAGRAIVAFAAFHYLDTSIGPYGEVGVVVPVVYGRKPLPVLPGVLEGRYPGFGALVLHLPVTTSAARDAGRGQWGYTKFVADMRFTSTPEYDECQLAESGKEVLTMRVARRGVMMRDRAPLVTYSVRSGDLIKTTIPQRGTAQVALGGAGSFIRLGDHEVARSLAELGLRDTPFMTRRFLERSAILPAGEVVERGVEPLDGFTGTQQEGQLEAVFGQD